MLFNNAFSAQHEKRITLYDLLIQHRELLLGSPANVVRPLVQCLADIHAGGAAHGAVSADRMLFFISGALDTDFFRMRNDKLSAFETYSYYSGEHDSSLDQRQRRDVRALGCVLHLLITGALPPPPVLRDSYSLTAQKIHEAWPKAFVHKVEQILAASADQSLPSFAELLESIPPSTSASSPLNLSKELQVHEDRPSLPADVIEPPAKVPSGEPQLPETRGVSESSSPAPSAEPKSDHPEPVTVTVSDLPVSSPAEPFSTPVRLPNIMVGREVSFDLLQSLSTETLPFDLIEPANDLPAGLSCESSILQGLAQESGEFEISLQCRPALPDPSRPATLTRKILLTINPDPRSLWKNLASDSSVPFWKPDTDASALPNSPFLVAGASLRGRSHAHVGSCRDDDFAMEYFSNSGWYSLTVADGAGSAQFSREGARIAVQYVRNHFTEYFQADEKAEHLTQLAEAWAAEKEGQEAASPTLKNALYHEFGKAAIGARRAIDGQANAVEALARDFHTTLITVLIKPLASGAFFLAAFSIGDGASAVIGEPNAETCLLTRPDGGEFAGQTVFLTMKDALATGESILNRIQCKIVSSLDAVLLVTDGISDPRFDSDSLLADPSQWTDLWKEVRPLVEDATSRDDAAQRLLEWMNFPSPGHHDDRTIIVFCNTKLP